MIDVIHRMDFIFSWLPLEVPSHSMPFSNASSITTNISYISTAVFQVNLPPVLWCCWSAGRASGL